MRKIDHPIEVIEKKIEADGFYSGVIRDGHNCARINLPRHLVGKKCYVIVIEGEG
jgi:putative transposon-encoded protein